MRTLVLVHSPLVGPYTWGPMAAWHRARGGRALVPDLRAHEAEGPPYRERHVTAVVEAVGDLPADEPLALVAHSGAGALIPLLGVRLGTRVTAFLFVDAIVPVDGLSRLDLLGDDAPAFRARARDGILSAWAEADLVEAIPEPRTRRAFAAELRPMPLAVYEEPIPVPPGWRGTASCRYLQLTGSYRADAARAAAVGCPVTEVPGRHFDMLNDPARLGEVIVRLLAS